MRCLIVGLLLLSWLDSSVAQELAIARIERSTSIDYESEIKPILQANCWACHSGKSPDGGLALDSITGMLEGGDSGPALQPLEPAESLLFLVASHQEESFMPPDDNEVGARQLTSQELGLLQRWIQEGAQDAETTSARSLDWGSIPADFLPIHSVAGTEFGRILVVGRGVDLYVCDAVNRKPLQQLRIERKSGSDGRPHRDIIQSVAISSDGYWIASGGFRRVQIWKRVDHPDSAISHSLQDVRHKAEFQVTIRKRQHKAIENAHQIAEKERTEATQRITQAEKELAHIQETITAKAEALNNLAEDAPEKERLAARQAYEKAKREAEAAAAALAAHKNNAATLEQQLAEISQQLTAAAERLQHAEAALQETSKQAQQQSQQAELSSASPNRAQWKHHLTIQTKPAAPLSDRVVALAFDPSARRLAVGSGEPSRSGELNLYEVNSGKLIRSLENPHSDTILSLDFDPAGERLVTGSADRFAKVFRVTTGQPLFSLEGHTDYVTSVDWHPDGTTILTASADRSVKIWDAETGAQRKSLDAFERSLTAGQFLGASDQFFVGGGMSMVVKASLENDNRQRIQGMEGFVHSLHASPLGKNIAVGLADGKLLLLDRQADSVRQMPWRTQSQREGQ